MTVLFIDFIKDGNNKLKVYCDKHFISGRQYLAKNEKGTCAYNKFIFMENLLCLFLYFSSPDLIFGSVEC